MPLYGHEMDDAVSPLETGLGAYVKMDKPAFIGREALAGAAPQRTRVGLRMVGRGIAREGFPVSLDGRGVGHVTSGTHCPFVGAPVAMALVETACAQPGQTLEVEVRGKPVEAQVVPLPFYSRKK